MTIPAFLFAGFDREVRQAVELALQEDLTWGDLTTQALVAPGTQATGQLVAKQAGVLAGTAVFDTAYALVDPHVRIEWDCSDGQRVSPGQVLARLSGPATGLLSGERVALNFLQHLSGIATLTRAFADAVRGLPVRLVDTRKTTPGLRTLEKWAVRVGGGWNHRHNLSDGVLIKENHLAAVAASGVPPEQVIPEAIRRVRLHAPHTARIEIEVERLDQIEPALAAGADILLLDNMSLPTLREAVRLVNRRALTEASGNVRLETVRAIAETGVDMISVGALTHSAPALDLSIRLEMAG